MSFLSPYRAAIANLFHKSDSLNAPRRVALAEHPREVRLHEAAIVDGFRDHLFAFRIRGSGRPSVVKRSLRRSLPVRSEVYCPAALWKELFIPAIVSPNPPSRRGQFCRSRRHAVRTGTATW